MTKKNLQDSVVRAPDFQGHLAVRRSYSLPSSKSTTHVMNDNAESDFLRFVRDPVNGFLCMTLPLKGGTELCAEVA